MLRYLILLTALLFPAFAGAMERVVQPSDGALVEALKTAQAGDTLRLLQGTYYGPIVIEMPLTLIGEGATIDGQEIGSTITINAPDVTIRGLTIIGSGSGGGALDAGITLTKLADNAVIEGKYLLRACIVNFRTTLSDVEALPEIVIRLGRELDSEMRPKSLQSG